MARARALVLAAFAAPTVAVWGTSGAWELVAGAGGPRPPLLYRGATSVAGAIVAMGNNSATGATCAFAFDNIANAWTQWPDLAAAQLVGDPFTFADGGRVVVVDELDITTLLSIDSAAAAAGGGAWAPLAVTGGPSPARFGQRFLAWGSSLYMFGGVDIAAPSTPAHNDVWALDLTAAFAGPRAAWALVTADGVAGLPPGRVGFSFTPFGLGAVVYGGVSVLDPASGLGPMDCYAPANAAKCRFHESVWAFTPGLAGAQALGSGVWARLNEAGADGATPAGRFSHTAGAMGDQLFVFGGTTAKGAAADLWAYNLAQQAWSAVAPVGAAPGAAGSDVGYGVGHVVGYHLLQFVQRVDDASGEPAPGGGALWRFTPAVAGAPAAGAAPAASPAVSAAGVNAGFSVLGLLALANTALLARALRKGDGGAASAAQAGGFYPAGGAYAPPMN